MCRGWRTAEPYGSSQNGINGIGGEFERPSANTPSLDRMSRSWQTPATDSFRSRSGDRKDEQGLDQQSSSFLPLLATSTPGDASSPSDLTSRQLSPTNTWQTPCAGTNRKSERAMQPSVNNGRRSGGGQSSPPGLEQQAEMMTRQSKAKLNPQFVEWLMGLPIGWTGSAPAVTAWSHWRQRMHSSLWQLVRG